MPSIIRSDKWFARVTVPKEFAIDKTKSILGWIDLKSLLVATHMGSRDENPHIHLVIALTSEIQKQSFDVRLKKLYGVAGNQQYSSKLWDGDDAACSYLFHEADAEIIYNRGHTTADIERYKKLNADVQKVVEANKSRASHRHVDKIIEKMNQSGKIWTRRDVLEEFIHRIKDGEMYDPGDFMLKRYIEEIMIKQLATPGEMDAYVHDRYYSLYRT